MKSPTPIERSQEIRSLRQRLADEKATVFDARHLVVSTERAWREAANRVTNLEGQHPDQNNRSARVQGELATRREVAQSTETEARTAEAQLKAAEDAINETEAELQRQRDISLEDIQAYQQEIANTQAQVARLATVESGLLAKLESPADDAALVAATTEYQRLMTEHAQDRATADQVQQAKAVFEKAKALFAKHQANAQATNEATELTLAGIRRERQQALDRLELLDEERPEWQRLLIQALWPEAAKDMDEIHQEYQAALGRCRMLQEAFHRQGGSGGEVGTWNPKAIHPDLNAAKALEQERLAKQNIGLLG